MSVNILHSKVHCSFFFLTGLYIFPLFLWFSSIFCSGSSLHCGFFLPLSRNREIPLFQTTVPWKSKHWSCNDPQHICTESCLFSFSLSNKKRWQRWYYLVTFRIKFCLHASGVFCLVSASFWWLSNDKDESICVSARFIVLEVPRSLNGAAWTLSDFQPTESANNGLRKEKKNTFRKNSSVFARCRSVQKQFSIWRRSEIPVFSNNTWTIVTDRQLSWLQTSWIFEKFWSISDQQWKYNEIESRRHNWCDN